MDSCGPNSQSRAATDDSSSLSGPKTLTQTATTNKKSTTTYIDSVSSPAPSTQSVQDVIRDSESLFTRLGVGAEDVRAGRIGAVLGAFPDEEDFNMVREHTDASPTELELLQTEKSSAWKSLSAKM